LATAHETPEKQRIISFKGGSIAFPLNSKNIKSTATGLLIVQSPDGQIQVSVTVTYFRPSADQKQNHEMFERVVALRMDAERKTGDGVTMANLNFKRFQITQ